MRSLLFVKVQLVVVLDLNDDLDAGQLDGAVVV